MADLEQGLTRRDVLTGLLGAATASVLANRRAEASPPRARVVRVESPGAWKGGSRDPQVIARMLEKGLLTFTGESKADAAWRRFFAPGMRVGLKINLLGRPHIYTAHELTDAVASGVILAGVKPADIVIWDRHADHFGPTTYKPGRGSRGERIMTGGRYDTSRVLHASGGSAPIDLIPVTETDVTVNLPVLKDHGGSGVTLALKNIAFGCYDHHSRAHGGNCDPYIAEAYEHFVANTKAPLIVLDATLACFDNGPQPFDQGSMWKENAIYVATDPVALDVVCREVINARRRSAGLADVTRRSRHIETAASKGLGVGTIANIDLVTVAA